MTLGSSAGQDDRRKARYSYRMRTRWPWWKAVIYTGFAVLSAVLAAQVAILGFATAGVTAVHWQVLSALAVSQVVSTALIWWAAGWYGDKRYWHLALDPPREGGRAYLRGYLIMLAVFGAISAALWLIDPERVLGDLTLYAGLVRSEAWWLAVLVIVVGAPVMEEVMFRGFLFPALARGPLGMTGAAVTSSAAWAGLHAGYSLLGLLEVFAVGLYFSWLLVRTGSLRVPMFCHAAYNASALVLLVAVDNSAQIAG